MSLKPIRGNEAGRRAWMWVVLENCWFVIKRY